MSEAIANAFLSQSQYDYLVRSLQSQACVDSDISVQIVEAFVAHYYYDYKQQKGCPKANGYRKVLSQNVAYVAAHISRLSEKGGSSSIDAFPTGVTIDALQIMCQEHAKYKEKNLKTFQDITEHHSNIKRGVGEDNTTINRDGLYNEEALKTYAVAAHFMGAKDWVKNGNDWMRNQAVQYFLQGGAKKRRLKDQRKSSGSEQCSNGDRKRKSSEPVNGSGDLLRLVDVGSCYNPFESPTDKSIFEVVALDLRPVDDSSVYKCDFLELRVGGSTSSLIATLLPGCGKGASNSSFKLCQLPGGNYDVVCMSLVLSYLPSPQSRLHMVSKARELLKGPCSSSEGYYGGLLLIVEKESVLAGSLSPELKKRWRESVESVGFAHLRYELLSTGDRRSHCYAFRAVDRSSSGVGGPIDGLYIRSDQ